MTDKNYGTDNLAEDISLYNLEEQIGLQLTDDPRFTQWVSESTPVIEQELQVLNRMRSNYLN